MEEFVARKIKDDIPNGFYKIFSSKYRETYFLYLMIIFNEVQKCTRPLKSITKYDCKDIVKDVMHSDVYDDKFDGEVYFEDSILNNLINSGWLKLEYDVSVGEDVLIIPKYSIEFIKVIIKINEEEKITAATIRSVFALVKTYYSMGPCDIKNIDYLLDAYNEMQNLGISLTAMLDSVQNLTQRTLQIAKDKPSNLIGAYIEQIELEYKNRREIFANGNFINCMNFVNDTIDEVEENLYKDLRFVQEALTTETDETSIKEWEEMEKGYRTIEYHLDSFFRETQKVQQLFEEYSNIEKEASNIITKKIKFISMYDSTEINTKFSNILLYLSKQNEEEMDKWLYEIAEKVATTETLSVFDSEGLTIPIPKEKYEFNPEQIDDSEYLVSEDEVSRYEKKYTREEMQEFIKQITVDGVISCNENTIHSELDFDKLFEFWFENVRKFGETGIDDEIIVDEGNTTCIETEDGKCLKFESFIFKGGSLDE